MIMTNPSTTKAVQRLISSHSHVIFQNHEDPQHGREGSRDFQKDFAHPSGPLKLTSPVLQVGQEQSCDGGAAAV